MRTNRFLNAGALAVAVTLGAAACTAQESTDDAGASAGAGAGGDAAAAASLEDINIALVPGGAHPYFQPWQAGGDAAVEDFGIGGVTFDETSEWDQTKQNAALNSLGSAGAQRVRCVRCLGDGHQHDVRHPERRLRRGLAGLLPRR